MKKGNIINKESFLHNVANQLGRERKSEGVQRPRWNRQPQWDVLSDCTEEELMEVFEKQCASIHTDVIRTDAKSVGQMVRHVLESNKVRSVITWDDPRYLTYEIKYELDLLQDDGDLSFHEWDTGIGEENIHKAEQADVGITFSDFTLAESGTVVLFSDNGKGRSVSLLPSSYIAIVPKSTIVPRLSHVTREIHQRVENGERVSSCVNFISGPSNSGDIEMNLVVGVHGPIKATYIVIEDS